MEAIGCESGDTAPAGFGQTAGTTAHLLLTRGFAILSCGSISLGARLFVLGLLTSGSGTIRTPGASDGSRRIVCELLAPFVLNEPELLVLPLLYGSTAGG